MQKFMRWSGWSLLVGSVTAIVLWAALFVQRAREQQQAVAALHEVEVVEYMCVLPPADGTSVPAGAGISRSKIASPVEFAPHGPAWIRSKLGEEWCHNWIDTPVGIDLAGSEANDADLMRLTSFPALQRLDIIWTKGSAKGMMVVALLPKLEKLTFGSEDLTDSDLVCLERLKSLRVLWLSGQIGDTGIEMVSRLPALADLWISSPNITDEGLRSVSRIKTLENLSLNSAKITDTGVRELTKVPRLKQVYLGHIQGISDECLEDLRRPPFRISVSYEPYGPPP
jgi:hypothetical protein